MHFPLRRSLRTALTVVGALVATAGSAHADTVRFAKGQSSTLSDGRIYCTLGVTPRGVGSVECSGPEVWQRWEREAACGSQGIGIRAIRLREAGRSIKGVNCGVGGSLTSERGDAIVAGDIRGRHHSGGGFTFRNPDGHGFTLTANRLKTF